MNRNELFNHLKNDVYCRLKKSTYGVGIFAIKKIPAGTDPFRGINNDYHSILFSKEEIQTLDPAVQKMIFDFCSIEGENVYVPSIGLNAMDISFFLNHSDNPNIVTIDNGATFKSSRSIGVDEELTIDYSTYTDEHTKHF